MCLELYLAVNLIADLALLGSVSRALGLFNGRNVFTAATLCALYAVLAASRPLPWALPPFQAAVAALAALVVSRRAASRIWSSAFLSIICAALVCGGTAKALGLVGSSAMPVCAAAGLALSALLYTVRPPAREGWQIWLCLTQGERTVRFPALIDTGNRLREPSSGLPVLIAEASLLNGVFPTNGCRSLRFGGVGGEGSMPCFKPGGVWIERNGRRRRAPEVWVAASPTPLPGLHCALAPPEFALYRI